MAAFLLALSSYLYFILLSFSFVCSVYTLLIFFGFIIGPALLNLHARTFKYAELLHIFFNLNLVDLLFSCGITLQDLSVIIVLSVRLYFTCRPAVVNFAFAKILNYNYCIFNITSAIIAFSWLCLLCAYSPCRI